MTTSGNKHNDTMAKLRTFAGAISSRYFFSLKWKVLSSFSIFLLIVNIVLGYIGYTNFSHQFEDQLQRSAERSTHVFNSLLNQARMNLQNLGESLALEASSNDNTANQLTHHIQHNWDSMQLNWSINSASVYDSKANLLSHIGNDKNIAEDSFLIQEVIKNGVPITTFQCTDECALIAAIPALLNTGDIQILIIKSSIADLIIDFSRGNADGSVLLIKNASPNDYAPWGFRISAATQRNRDHEILTQATKKFDYQKILGNGAWFTANDQHAYHLHAIAIGTTASDSENTLLVLIEDITAQRNTINLHIRQHIITATLGMLACEALLLFILWNPMRRITKQADILPRLAHGNYLQEPGKSQNISIHATHDELDVLEDATFELSQRLQTLSHDIQQRASTLEYMALYDHLTGLANRRLFLDHLSQAINEFDRTQEKFAVLFFDLDHFKRVNDSFGHDVGDELLKQVAQRLRENTRATDTVARLSGDEFTVLLQHIDKGEALLHLIEKIRLSLQIPVAVGATQILVTPSIGIVIAPDNGLRPDDLLRNADVAMYEAKRAGGNSYYFFSEEINLRATQLLRLENELRDALDNRQFFLLYQPLVDLFSMQIIGVEALVRWRHPERGVVSPAEFIEVMENNGMIIELGTQVVAQACRDLALLGDHKPSFTISVNLSPRQLHDRSLVETLDWLLRSNHIDPRRLKIEITENSLIEDVDENIELLNQLKEMGLSLSIDDFGTGYSSLSYLKMLPVDELKVDRRFISDITTDIDDREITAAVIAMAHKLQLRVVAEGIEAADQLDFLRRNHCDTGQGFLFSEPVPFENILLMLQAGIVPMRHGI